MATNAKGKQRRRYRWYRDAAGRSCGSCLDVAVSAPRDDGPGTPGANSAGASSDTEAARKCNKPSRACLLACVSKEVHKQQDGVEMTGHGRRWKTKTRFPSAFHSPWKSLAAIPTFPPPRRRAGKWKAKSTFPTHVFGVYLKTQKGCLVADRFAPAPGSFFNEKMLMRHEGRVENRAVYVAIGVA